MLILALDTATEISSLALARDGVILGEALLPAGEPPASVTLPDAVAELLARAAARQAEITELACTIGPGAFTGIRVGLAFLKGMAFARGLPLWGVVTLEAMALNAADDDSRLVAPALDARRQEIYAAVYRREGDGCEVVTPPKVIGAESWAKELAALGEPVTCLGRGYAAYAGVFGQLTGRFAAEPLAAAVLRRVSQWQLIHAAPPPLAQLEPLYLRAPEAERQLARRVAP